MLAHRPRPTPGGDQITETRDAVGPERGYCGHAHFTEAATQACAHRDHRRRAALPGGTSDPTVHRSDCLTVVVWHGGRCTCGGLPTDQEPAR